MNKTHLILLNKLKEGPLNSFEACYFFGFGKQVNARIRELRELGYNIQSIQNKDRSVDWVLVSGVIGTTPKPRLEDQYIFLPDGRAVLKENYEPEQLALT